jgi:hypothetical protein
VLDLWPTDVSGEHPAVSRRKEPSFRLRAALRRPPQPPYRYAGSHSVMPGHRYMITMQTITISM